MLLPEVAVRTRRTKAKFAQEGILKSPCCLLCESLHNPLGIDTSNPLFSWQGDSDATGLMQSGYRIIVSDINSNILWDTKKILSKRQTHIRYAGTELKPFQKYYWKVMYWDSKDQPSPWSETASFETGFFSIKDWKSSWIGHCISDSLVHARKEFTIKSLSDILNARLYTASTTNAFGNLTMRMNSYVAYMNGNRVSDEIICPGQLSERKNRALYRAYDIRPLLKEGANCIGVVFASKSFGAEIHIEHTDGTKDIIGTDRLWKVQGSGPFTVLEANCNEYGGKGETYNTQKEFTGWNLPSFNETGWLPATEGNFPEILALQKIAVKTIESLSPISLTKNALGQLIVDIGQNINGHLEIPVTTLPSKPITIQYAENLYDDGNLDPRSAMNKSQGETKAQSDTYISSHNLKKNYRPLFSNHGFRYASIEGLSEKVLKEDIKAHVIHSDILCNNHFSCSNPLINRLHSASVWSLRSNMVSVPTDCPQRERNAWLGDALCISEAACLNFNMENFYEKWFNDISDCQLADGDIPYICPFPDWENMMKGNARFDIPWSSAAILVPWDTYCAYGNPHLLAKHFDIMEKWIRFLSRFTDKEGLIKSGVHWNDYMAIEYPTPAFIGNLYYYRSISLMEKIAMVIGKKEASATYGKLTKELRNKINCQYLKENMTYDNGCQSALAHALHFGLVPENLKEKITKALADDIKQRNGLSTGCLGTYCVIPALAENKRNDLVYKLVNQTNLGTWGYWFEHCKATTALEQWDGSRERSYNHAFLIGSIETWFYRHLAGFYKNSPGWETVTIKPFFPSDLKSAQAVIHSVKGRFSISWRRKNGKKIVLEISLPFNTRANVILPDQPPLDVKTGRHVFSI